MGHLLRKHGGLLAVVGLFAAALAGPAHAFSPVPDRTYVTNGTVRAVLRSGNTVYLGGDFTRVGPRTGSGAQLDPSSGQARAGEAEVSGGVILTSVADGSGGWYIGGTFTHVGGLVRPYLAHIRPDGTVDPAFNANVTNTGMFPPYVEALDLLGSTLYVGGYFSAIGGQPRNNIAVLNTADGTARSWNPASNGDVDAIRVYQNTKFTFVFVGGGFTHIGGQDRNYIAELGTADNNATSWNPSADSYVRALAITGGFGLIPLRVYAGGDFNNIGGQPRNYIAQLDGIGNAVAAWDGNADGTVYAVAANATTVYAGGSFSTIGSASHRGLAALNPSTGGAITWNADVNQFGGVYALFLSSTTLYVGGSFDSVGGQPRDNLAAVGPNSAVVAPWNPSPFGTVDVVWDAGTSIYAGGDFSGAGGQVRHHLAAVDAFTGAPTSWNPDADGAVETFAPSGSTLYIGGNFTHLGGQPRAHLGAVDLTTGALRPGWRADTDYTVHALVVSGSTVYVGGNFSMVGGVARNHLAALDATTGTPKSGWDPNPNGFIHALALSGPTLYVGGEFHSFSNQPSIGGQRRDYLAALDTATGVVGSWNPGASYVVDALLPLGSLVYVGGDFTKIGVNGKTRNYLAAVDAAGNATDWDPNASSSVFALASAPGTIYAGGTFVTIGGQPRTGVAALDPATGKATSWSPKPGAFVAWTYTLAFAGGTLYDGGPFTTLALGAQEGYASFSEAPVKTASPAITGTGKVRNRLTCSTGSWSGSIARFSFAWLRDGNPIGGATNASYAVTLADGGHGLACRVTAVNLAGSASAASAAVQVPANCFVPKLKGKTLKSARRALKRAHCRLGKVRKRAAKGKAGRVLKQTPKAHTTLPNGSKVNLVISRKRKR
jgi:hypothetical protein